MAKLRISKQVHEVTGGSQHCVQCNRPGRYSLLLTCWEIAYGDRFWRLGRRITRTCLRCGTVSLLKRPPADDLEFPLLEAAAAPTTTHLAVAPPPEEFGGGSGRVVDQQFLGLLWEALGLLRTDVGAGYQEAIYDQAHPGVWGLLYDYAGNYARDWVRNVRTAPVVPLDTQVVDRALTRGLFDAALEGYILYWLEAVHKGRSARRPRKSSADRFVAQVNPRAFRLAERAQTAYDPAVLYLMWERAGRGLGDLLHQGVPQLSKVRQESVRQVLWLYSLGYAVGAEEHRLEEG